MKLFGITVKPQWKSCFIWTCIIGFLTYFYTISHHFLSYDSVWNLYSDQDMISSGRPFLQYACQISSFYDLPAVNGFLAVFYLALTAVIIVEIFEIRSNWTAAVIGGFSVTFPSIIETFCHTYTVDGYMLAVLLITLAFFLTNRFRFGFIPGILLTAFSIGVYQAYFSYLIALCIIYLLVYLTECAQIKMILQKSARYLLMGVGGYALYLIGLRGMLLIKDAALSGYQGSDAVFSFSPQSLIENIPATIRSVFVLTAWGNVFTTTEPMKVAYIVLLLSAVILYICRFVQKKCYKSIFHVVFALALILVLPFGLNLITLMNPNVFYTLLMRYSWMTVFIFPAILSDRLLACGEQISVRSLRQEKHRRFPLIMRSLVSVFSAVMIFEFGIVANIVAFNMEERYEKSYALCIRLVDRLEQTPGYQTGMEVALLGGLPSQVSYPPTSVTTKDLSGYFGASGEVCFSSTERFATFCAHYLNVTITTISGEREIALVGTEEFQNMPHFPAEGSIRLIDGVWVIKINN